MPGQTPSQLLVPRQQRAQLSQQLCSARLKLANLRMHCLRPRLHTQPSAQFQHSTRLQLDLPQECQLSRMFVSPTGTPCQRHHVACNSSKFVSSQQVTFVIRSSLVIGLHGSESCNAPASSANTPAVPPGSSLPQCAGQPPQRPPPEPPPRRACA